MEGGAGERTDISAREGVVGQRGVDAKRLVGDVWRRGSVKSRGSLWLAGSFVSLDLTATKPLAEERP